MCLPLGKHPCGGTYRLLSWTACPSMRIVTAFDHRRAEPWRGPRSTASRTTVWTLGATSLPSTTPRCRSRGPVGQVLDRNWRDVGVEYAYWLFSTMRTIWQVEHRSEVHGLVPGARRRGTVTAEGQHDAGLPPRGKPRATPFITGQESGRCDTIGKTPRCHSPTWMSPSRPFDGPVARPSSAGRRRCGVPRTRWTARSRWTGATATPVSERHRGTDSDRLLPAARDESAPEPARHEAGPRRSSIALDRTIQRNERQERRRTEGGRLVISTRHLLNATSDQVHRRDVAFLHRRRDRHRGVGCRDPADRRVELEERARPRGERRSPPDPDESRCPRGRIRRPGLARRRRDRTMSMGRTARRSTTSTSIPRAGRRCAASRDRWSMAAIRHHGDVRPGRRNAHARARSRRRGRASIAQRAVQRLVLEVQHRVGIAHSDARGRTHPARRLGRRP